MPESYPTRWHPQPTAAERALREMEESVRAAILVLKHDERHVTADRLENALQALKSVGSGITVAVPAPAG